MKINKISEFVFNDSDTITCATLSKVNEVVLLMSSGDVVRLNLDDKSSTVLFWAGNNDGSIRERSFDAKAQSSIYTLDEIVVVANDLMSCAFVHHPGYFTKLQLTRSNDHHDISVYPIAIYNSDNGIPHLIYGQAWNHIQIMNLNTRQVLTAAKSLILENAEERFTELEQKHPSGYRGLWPLPYDYFYGRLFLSPDRKKFLSAGWVWGSNDAYTIYDIGKFISDNRISFICIGVWEHQDRSVCWVANDLMAVVYDPFAEGDEGADENSPYKMRLIHLSEQGSEIVQTIQLADRTLLSARMYFLAAQNTFVFLSAEHGVSVISMNGELVFRDVNLKLNEFKPEMNLFLKAEGQTLSVYQFSE